MKEKVKKIHLFFQKHFDEKKFFSIFQVIFIFIFIFFCFTTFQMGYSKYESRALASSDIAAAFFITDVGTLEKKISLGEIIPRDEPYIYTFLVSNYDDHGRTEVNVDYEIYFETTTNLPLEFKLYKNQNYSNSGSTNIISRQEVITDAYGMYKKRLYINQIERFTFSKNETNVYQLVVTFPSRYQNMDIYAGMIEGISIVVKASQVIE